MPSSERVTPSSEQMEVIADDSESVSEHAEVMRDSIIEVALVAGQVLSRRPAGVSRDEQTSGLVEEIARSAAAMPQYA